MDQEVNQDHRAVGELVTEMSEELGLQVLIYYFSACSGFQMLQWISDAAVGFRCCSGQGWTGHTVQCEEAHIPLYQQWMFTGLQFYNSSNVALGLPEPP